MALLGNLGGADRQLASLPHPSGGWRSMQQSDVGGKGGDDSANRVLASPGQSRAKRLGRPERVTVTMPQPPLPVAPRSSSLVTTTMVTLSADLEIEM
jgi:hypothetical protein